VMCRWSQKGKSLA